MPTFDKLWRTHLEELFTDSILVAHNAVFDLTVLEKTLGFYEISLPERSYSCTLEMSYRCCNGVPNNKLSTICEHFGIPLHHHDALSDALGCAAIFDEMFKRHGQNAIVISQRPTSKAIPRSFRKGTASTKETLTVGNLLALLSVIVADSRVSTEEALVLNEWLHANEALLPKSYFQELTDSLYKMLVDGVIDEEESEHLLRNFNHLLRPDNVDCHIDFVGKTFCLTGNFEYGEKIILRRK